MHFDDKDLGYEQELPGEVASWTAQDLSNFFTRFRPHLEAHASKFLRDRSMADEVVQDAFLYLMVALPELDSELGVLRFLKWKVRLLCLDVIKASSREITGEEENLNSLVSEADPGSDLERAEDAAIVRLALAKLDSRQREALIASVYEEKSTPEIAMQLQISENATRQLLLRARNSLRTALIGQANVSGLGMSQILSIAAKKAVQDARRNASKVGVFIGLLALGLGLIPALQPSSSSLTASSSLLETPEIQADDFEASAATSEAIESTEEGPLELTESVSQAPSDASTQESPENSAIVAEEEVSGSEPNVTVADARLATAQPQQRLSSLSTSTLGTILTTNVSQAGFYTNSKSHQFSDLFRGVSIEVFGGTGISAFLDFDPESRSVSSVIFQLWVEENRYFAIAKSTNFETTLGSRDQVLVTAQEFYVVDELGNVGVDTPLANAKALVSLSISPDGRPESASLVVAEIN